MPLAIGLLIVLCAILLFRLAMLEKDLRSGAGQLKDRRETASGAPLRLAAPNASAEAARGKILNDEVEAARNARATTWNNAGRGQCCGGLSSTPYLHCFVASLLSTSRA